jgi:hypothetical protein
LPDLAPTLKQCGVLFDRGLRVFQVELEFYIPGNRNVIDADNLLIVRFAIIINVFPFLEKPPLRRGEFPLAHCGVNRLKEIFGEPAGRRSRPLTHVGNISLGSYGYPDNNHGLSEARCERTLGVDWERRISHKVGRLIFPSLGIFLSSGFVFRKKFVGDRARSRRDGRRGHARLAVRTGNKKDEAG